MPKVDINYECEYVYLSCSNAHPIPLEHRNTPSENGRLGSGPSPITKSLCFMTVGILAIITNYYKTLWLKATNALSSNFVGQEFKSLGWTVLTVVSSALKLHAGWV